MVSAQARREQVDYAVSRGLRPAGDNPARWRGHIEHMLPKKAKVARIEHFAALPYAEIGAFMAELRAVDSLLAPSSLVSY